MDTVWDTRVIADESDSKEIWSACQLSYHATMPEMGLASPVVSIFTITLFSHVLTGNFSGPSR